jgi:hypothetical protein
LTRHRRESRCSNNEQELSPANEEGYAVLHFLNRHKALALVLAGFAMLGSTVSAAYAYELLARGNGAVVYASNGCLAVAPNMPYGTQWLPPAGGLAGVTGVILIVAGICRGADPPVRAFPRSGDRRKGPCDCEG